MPPGNEGRGYSDSLARIMRQVLGDRSQGVLEQRVNGDISGPTFGRLKAGKVVSPGVLARVARHFLKEFSQHYGEAITAAHGNVTPSTVEQWLRGQIDAEDQERIREAAAAVYNAHPDEPTLTRGEAQRIADEAGRSAAREILEKAFLIAFDNTRLRIIAPPGDVAPGDLPELEQAMQETYERFMERRGG